MKKILGVLTLICLTTIVNAQDFKKVQASLLINQVDAAKAELEKVIAKKPALATTPEALYFKAKIYSVLAKDAVKNPNAVNDEKAALDAYITSEDASKGFPVAKENGSEPFFDLYLKNFKDGVTSFNDKKYPAAGTQFEQAVYYSDFIFANGWSSSKQKFDTISIMYAGFAYQNAKNEDKAIALHSRLIKEGVNTKEAIDAYKFALYYYVTHKQKENFDATLASSKKAYAKEDWSDYEFDYIDKNFSLEEKAKLYDEKVAANSLTETDCLRFGDAFIGANSKDDQDPKMVEKFSNKAIDAYKRAYTFNSKNATVAFNAGIAFYNQYNAIDDQVSKNIKALQTLNANKPVAPKDPKKKIAFEASFKAQQDSIKKLNVALDPSIKEKVDGAIEWMEKAYNGLKDKDKLERVEKNVMGRTVDILATLYSIKRDKARGKDQKAFDELDAKFNVFDKLHDKYN